MQELGLDAYRFSIAWPRVLPEGRGRVNEAGLDFYDRLVDDLLAAGIRPFVSLYHWDLPQALEDAGGWPSRATPEAFGEYVEVVARRLGDRVPNWLTQNEPYCVSWLGYALGLHAPGRTELPAAIAAAHHVLLSHGLAVQALRRESPESEVGIVLDSWPVYPASDDPRDAEAAKEQDGFRNRLFFDPVLRGSYPEDVLEHLGDSPPPVRDGDLAAISAPIDFVGLNNYSRTIIEADSEGKPQNVTNGGPTTEMGWEIYPKGIYDVLTRLHREYGVQNLYVTENGGAFPDVLLHDGRVEDRDRIDYLHKLPRRGRPRDRRRRPGPGLLRVVAARQLRVGLRLLAALRSPLRRLLDARASAQVELLLVPGPDRRGPASGARARLAGVRAEGDQVVVLDLLKERHVVGLTDRPLVRHTPHLLLDLLPFLVQVGH